MKALQIGITGGIGSGKTTVAEIFEAFGIPCYYADSRAKALMVEDEEVKSDLIEYFGVELYPDGVLNRPWLAKRIFESEEDRSFVNGVVHPAVGRDFNKWAEEQDAPYVLREAAILFETGGYKLSDANILVTAPEEIRIERVVNRDGVTADQVKARMRAQWSDDHKRKLADFIILNDGNTPLIPQVKHIHETLLSRANQKD